MRLRWHLVILAAIIVATLIIIPLPAVVAALVAAGEGMLYGWFILFPSRAGRRIDAANRRRLDR